VHGPAGLLILATEFYLAEWMSDFPSSRDEVGDNEIYFVLAGYSWRRSVFAIWTLHYQKDITTFTFREASDWRGIDGTRRLAMIGDAFAPARTRLTSLLTLRGKCTVGGFDMEPLEVLIEMIREHADHAIGGPPQNHQNLPPHEYAAVWHLLARPCIGAD
jgi:hypothetical protein